MKRQEDLVNMASGIVAERELITRRLVFRASAVIIGFEVIIAIALGVALWKNHELTRESECHVLEHRISSRNSDITKTDNQKTILRTQKTILETLQIIVAAAADPGPEDARLRAVVADIAAAAKSIDVKSIDVPKPHDTTEYERTCT